jgi:hypothetical protein
MDKAEMRVHNAPVPAMKKVFGDLSVFSFIWISALRKTLLCDPL